MAKLFQPLGAPVWMAQILRSIEQAFQRVERLPEFKVAEVPSAADHTRELIYVSNEAGGAVPAFSDGTNWRRVTDRAVIS